MTPRPEHLAWLASNIRRSTGLGWLIVGAALQLPLWAAAVWLWWGGR